MEKPWKSPSIHYDQIGKDVPPVLWLAELRGHRCDFARASGAYRNAPTDCEAERVPSSSANEIRGMVKLLPPILSANLADSSMIKEDHAGPESSDSMTTSTHECKSVEN
eukprot:gnl/TRDRNA2_/TRDRNA2_207999_c0_seq1.p1 gnl/TRDRNA2_/TRDRNA2_207999_c0~~gnl/TRDRNA2_/TRDRNA2_207999_c0_seq1.p1  ORF type:complete len:109 (+),score=13.51 gnl/TRDRNA2_/TRDRNA2_207999_c0_seq1:86-412(+)